MGDTYNISKSTMVMITVAVAVIVIALTLNTYYLNKTDPSKTVGPKGSNDNLIYWSTVISTFLSWGLLGLFAVYLASGQSSTINEIDIINVPAPSKQGILSPRLS